MKTEQRIWDKERGWETSQTSEMALYAQLVFLFGEYKLLKQPVVIERLHQIYPKAYLFGCSTSGAIHDTEVIEGGMVATAVWFERSSIRAASRDLDLSLTSHEIAEQLAQELLGDDLKHVFVVSDGLNTYGDDIVRGFNAHLPRGVQVSGGQAADSELFEDTLVVANEAGKNRRVAAVGLYGRHLECGYGCMGGLAKFGPSRRATRAEKNVLYEIDGEPALDLYKRYLGDMAEGLPATAVYFPMNLTIEDTSIHLVRTVTAIDEDKGALIFSANIPQDSVVTLMRANTESLVDGAEQAGEMCRESIRATNPQLALLVTCAARKMVLKQRVEEEVEAVRDVFDGAGVQTGFYSFGEICPAADHVTACEFHNQTMTVTTLCELED